MKALVYTQVYNSKNAGDIQQIMDDYAASKFRNSLLSSGVLEFVDIPESYSLEYIYTELVNGEWTIKEDQFAKNNDELESKKRELKEEMDAELYAMMAQVVGTTDFNSAIIFERTWEKMVANPSSYSGLGIRARFDRGTYDDGGSPVNIMTGDMLDTDDKIQGYAQACLDEVEEGQKLRLERIEQYKDDLAALIASYSGSV